MKGKLSVKEVAHIMEKDPQYVRKGLQTGRLPFGTAVKKSSRWSYHISPVLFAEYMNGKITRGVANNEEN